MALCIWRRQNPLSQRSAANCMSAASVSSVAINCGSAIAWSVGRDMDYSWYVSFLDSELLLAEFELGLDLSSSLCCFASTRQSRPDSTQTQIRSHQLW